MLVAVAACVCSTTYRCWRVMPVDACTKVAGKQGWLCNRLIKEHALMGMHGLEF